MYFWTVLPPTRELERTGLSEDNNISYFTFIKKYLKKLLPYARKILGTYNRKKILKSYIRQLQQNDF